MYILAILRNRTKLYKPYKRRQGKALRMYGFVLVYGLNVSQFPTVFQQEVEQGLVFHCNHREPPCNLIIARIHVFNKLTINKKDLSYYNERSYLS